MNERILLLRRHLIALLVLALAGPIGLSAQQGGDDENIFELSPFTIDESEVQGYMATSTLAGTRIKTDLRDLGASITVVTSEFMDDISATDAQSLLSYISNVEVGGNQGNFTGATDAGFGRFFQADARTNPQSNQRVRGLLSADLTRGFFLSDIPFDGYNTDRVEVSRGPNSLLFGIGSPGGVINNATKQAIQGNDFGELGIRFDNYGSWRTEFDYNKSLVDGRVALRVAVLNESQEYKQKPAFEDQERYYAALDIVLLENEGSDVFGSTVFRMNYEEGDQNGSPVEVIPPTIAYDTWFEPLSPGISQFTGGTPESVVLAPSDGGTWQFQALHDDPIGSAQVFTKSRPLAFRHVGMFYSERGSSPNVGIPGSDLGGYNGVIPWNANRDTIASVGLVGTPLTQGLPPDTPLRAFEDLRTTSAMGEPYAIGFAPPTLQNREVFDFHNHVYSNGLDRIEREFDAFNIALEQNFFDGQAAIEFAYDEQSYSTYQDFLFTGGLGTALSSQYDISVHNSVYLPNGQLNPNVGRAMTWVRRPTQREDIRDRETFRITAFAGFDFTENDGLLGWLGRHRITALYNDYTLDTFNRTTGDVTHSDEFNMDSAQQHRIGANVGRRSLNVTAYTSENSLIGLQSMDDVRLHPIDIQRYEVGDRFNYLWVDTTPAGALNSGVAGDRRLHTNAVEIVRIPVGGNISKTTIEAKALAWQSYFLDEHIVALYGYREDDTENFALNSAAEAGVPQRGPDEVFNPDFVKLSSTPRPKVEGQPNDTQTWSVVARYPEVLLGDLPFDLRAHWARSENFNPVGVRSNALGAPIFEPSGTTEEYGFTISTDDNKYSLKLNWYETRLANINAGVNTNLANIAFGRINTFRDAELTGIPFERQLDLASEADRASHPIQSYDQWYEATFNTIPQDLVDVVNPMQVDFDGDGLWDQYEFDAIPNLQATRDLLAEGFEVEFVANPTPSWRLMANLSQQETSFSNTAPLMYQINSAYIASSFAARLDEFRQDPTLTQDDELYGVSLPRIVTPIETERAKDGTVSNEQREWRFTGVSTYEFREGAFKGFGIGGAVRWEDEAATGYVTLVNPDTGAVIPDVNRPFFDDGLFSGDAWISYSRPILDGKVQWRVRLNVRNLVGESGNIPVVTNPDGQVAVVRIPNPRTIYLSNSFKF